MTNQELLEIERQQIEQIKRIELAFRVCEMLVAVHERSSGDYTETYRLARQVVSTPRPS